MDDRRRARPRFAAALALFVAWVAGLGVLAALSGRRPHAAEPAPAPAATARP